MIVQSPMLQKEKQNNNINNKDKTPKVLLTL